MHSNLLHLAISPAIYLATPHRIFSMGTKNLITSAWITRTALLGAVCACGPGCSSSLWGTQQYRPPALASGQGAIVKGGNGIYVVDVDNQNVRVGPSGNPGIGGNEVLLAPGKHRIRVERAVADVAITLRYSLSSKATFEHILVAGHSYDVRYTIGYEMVDETTGQTIQPRP